MGTNYDDLRLVELRALAKERGLQGYYRLQKAELIVLLRDASKARPDEPMLSELTQDPEALPDLQSLRHLPPPHLLKVHSLHANWRELSGEPIEVFEKPEEALSILRSQNSVIWIR